MEKFVYTAPEQPREAILKLAQKITDRIGHKVTAGDGRSCPQDESPQTNDTCTDGKTDSYGRETVRRAVAGDEQHWSARV